MHIGPWTHERVAGAVVDPPPERLFGAPVARRAGGDAERRAVREPRDAAVGDERALVVRRTLDEDVARGKIAVHDSRCMQRLGAAKNVLKNS